MISMVGGDWLQGDHIIFFVINVKGGEVRKAIPNYEEN